jgi:cold shock CspA family protein
MNGTIKSHFPDKQFGFIKGDNGKKYFFHSSACPELFYDLEPGMNVVFIDTMGKKGLRAELVGLIEE